MGGDGRLYSFWYILQVAGGKGGREMAEISFLSIIIFVENVIHITTRADARRPIGIYAHFLTLSLKISAN